MNVVVIAAPHSGSGKTTVTLGIMAALRRRGVVVAPFKVGPDFIDPGYHRLICGRPSVNLDGWICSGTFVRETFAHHAAGAEIAVVEGVMGLFDGMGGLSEEGSTSQTAKLLGAPVVLVVDARGQARSAAALVAGFAGFDPGVTVAGVIFNNVGSERHAALLREAVATGCPGVAVVGCIPRDEKLHIPSRHLGLLTAEENPLPAEFIEHLADTAERHLELDFLLRPHPQPLSPGERVAEGRVRGTREGDVRIAVARDAAFCFVYEDNLRLLAAAGAECVPFSPLADSALPSGIGGLYLPGGYPELFADTLAANNAMREAIRAAVEDGMPVYAECGGFIYLSRGIRGQDLTPLVGIFPVTARMLPRRRALGYREIGTVAASILGPAGTVARGHEFHYSEMEEMPAEVARLYRVSRQGKELGYEGYRYRNCLASYVHLHFGSNPAVAAHFVASCREYKGE